MAGSCGRARWASPSWLFTPVCTQEKLLAATVCLVSSSPFPPSYSFLSYLGPFNKAFRDTQLQKELAAACTSLGVATTPHLQVGI